MTIRDEIRVILESRTRDTALSTWQIGLRVNRSQNTVARHMKALREERFEIKKVEVWHGKFHHTPHYWIET